MQLGGRDHLTGRQAEPLADGVIGDLRVADDLDLPDARRLRAIRRRSAQGNHNAAEHRKQIASLYGSMSLSNLFGAVAAFGIGAGVVMLIIAAPIKRLMGEVN